MAIKFNIEPYYDDFEVAGSDGLSPKEKYNRILFRPGHAVQARELTQIQSMLQHQISSTGQHLFKEGSMVIPGHTSIETNLDYIKLDNINSTDLDELIGLTFTGSTTGLTAKVVAVAASEGTDPNTLYVKYTNGGSSNTETVFDDAETITSGSFTGTVATNGTGFGSVAFLEEGIYFIDNHFVVVKSDQLILDKYETTPSYDIGLEVTESIATSAEDVSLNDNANGTPNYAAPGAHRYKISTKLVKQANEATTIEKFLLLLRIVDGEIIKQVRATEYSVLEETLARRTFDESGNYTVRPFTATLHEHTAINTPGDETKLSVGLESGKAYVRGYECETYSTTYVSLNKARDSELFEAASVPMQIGNYVTIDNVEGIPDITTFAQMEIRNGTGGTGGIIGYARARSYVYNNSGEYNIYLFDIQMSSNYYFQDARSFRLAGTPEFVADIVLTSGNAIIKEPNRNSMVFPLPFNRVKTCDSQPDDVADDFNYVYFANRDVGSALVGGGQAVFNTVGANELFEPFDDENWILTIASGTNSGNMVNLTSSDVTIAANSQTATISGLSTHDGETVRLIAGVKRTLNHKSKSLTTGGADNVDLYPINTPSDTDWMPLGHADGYRLKGVFQSADLSTAATINDEDVTEYFEFDNGQRDNYYGISRVRVKPQSAWRHSGRLVVQYEYFTHTGSGDFFSVDSYQGLEDSDGNTVGYEDIPDFQSNTGELVELRSAIDFRPRIDNSGGNFSGTGASVTVCPEPVTTFTTDVQYYLDRIDKVFINKEGEFGVVEGVSSLTPKAPSDPKEAMVLYQMRIPAYTIYPNEVDVSMVDNKRYTMRDIGAIEKRVNALEYYTSLSLLEKDAENRDIIDAATQTQRIKSGFIVDSFASHSIGNVLSTEYRAAIDRQRRNLRPTFSEDNVRLVFNSTLSGTDGVNYKKTGDIVTLPYVDTTLANQPVASNYINVNPYEVFSWDGSVELSPSSDEWKDTTRRPDVVVNQDGIFDAMMEIIDETDALGTQWNEWENNWTGEEKSDEYTATWGDGSRRGWGNRVAQAIDVRQTGFATRTGIETSVSPQSVRTNIGDRVVEINFAPYIRSRIIAFKATRLKPNTTVKVFFDGADVSNFVRPETDPWTDLQYGVNDNPVVNGKNTYTQHPLGSGTLTTDASGELIGSFFIPNNETTFFKTGSREFKITDSTTNNDSFATTTASALYNAKGLLETKENVTISTRIPRIEKTAVDGRKNIASEWTQQVIPGTVDWYDPLAQSFIVPLKGGAFITGIDLYFHTKDENVPVTLQIREMQNGIPTQKVIPFSEVTLNPSDVNVVDLTNQLPSSTEVTAFNFESPVYLQDGIEYCFVLMANSNAYQVWYAQIGDNDHATNTRISKQPYAGVLFKSQNASTWTPDQNKDLKFKIRRAQFDTSATCNIILENGSVQKRQLIKNPFVTTSGSNQIRVIHKNHHMFNNTNAIASYVTISGATSVNGIPASEINATHEVSDVEMDSYVITVTTNATGTGIDGGTAVEATENQLYNTFYTNVAEFNLPGTNSTWGVRTSTGMSLGATSPTPYVTTTSFTPIIPNASVNVNDPGVIASDDNEQSGPTFFLRGTLTSTSDNISPFIDLERCSVFTIANRVDYPKAVGASGVGNEVNDYTAETDPVLGSAKAKYVTRNIKLADTADGIRVFMDINRKSNTDVEVYYRVSDDEDTLSGLNWTLASPEEPIPFDDSGFYTETEYVIDPPGVFSVFSVKIVMKSTNSSRVPTIRDLRIIALQP